MKIRLMVSMLTVMLMCSGCDVAADGRHGAEKEECKREVVANIGGIMWNMEDPGIEMHDNGSTMNAMSRALEANGAPSSATS